MADKKFTLVELHLGDGSIQIGPASIGDGGAETAETDDEADEDDAEAGGRCPGRTAGKLLLVVAAVALLAVVARALLGGDEDLDELEDLADLDTE